MIKRIFLFLLTNILVMATISIVLNILGVNYYITANGLNYYDLMIVCFVWGMVGAFISLAMSRIMAKWMLGIQVIDPRNPGQLSWLVDMVTQLSRASGLPSVPEIGIYDSAEVNAFATGPTKRRSLVAFSTGILGRMSREELSGVVGHELTHIRNGDMVTMTLLQGVVNAFVMFLSRVVSFFISQGVKEENRRMVNWLLVFVFDIVFTILGSIVVCWFSRRREFRADAGSAQVAGRERMIGALESLERYSEAAVAGNGRQQALATLKISGKTGRFGQIFATHPPLEERINRLRNFK